MGTWAREFGFAARALRRAPRFTALVTATLALAIGMNAAIFGVADRLLLRGPDHVADAGDIVRLHLTVVPPNRPPFQSGILSFRAYDALSSIPSLSALAAYNSEGTISMGHGSDAELVTLGQATWTLFPMLGVRPALGRFYTEDEDDRAGASNVVVLGHGLWQRAFGGHEDVLGQSVVIGGVGHTVVGVAPEGFTGAELGGIDVWLPVSARGPAVSPQWAESWNSEWLTIVGRLATGATPEQAAAQATTAYRAAYDGTMAVMREGTFGTAPLRYDRNGREPMEAAVARWLAAVAGIVLVIACANVVNLVLARTLSRRRDVAVRRALGAGGRHVLRLLLAEGLLLGAAGTAAGLGLAAGAGTAIRSLLLPNVSWTTASVDGRTFLVSSVLALLVGIGVGLGAALIGGRTDVASVLKDAAGGSGRRTGRLRAALTVTQAALAVVLLAAAALFVRSLWNVRTLDMGMDAEGTLVITLRRASVANLPGAEERQQELQRRNDFFLEAMDRLRELPGVRHAAVSKGLPFRWGFVQPLRVDGRDSIPRGSTMGPDINAVTDDYFATLATPLVRGRTFTAADRAGSEPVSIVNAAMARTLWPGRDAIGECLYIGRPTESAACASVVGVVADAWRFSLRGEPGLAYYVPFGQESGMLGNGTFLLARLDERAPTPLPAIREALSALDGSVTYVDVRTLQDAIDPQVRSWRLGAAMFGAMGALALLMATFGLYSVVSFLVAERTPELGVRIALGARAVHVLSIVLRGSVGAAAAGVVVGLALTLVAGRWVEPLLFDVSYGDPGILAGVAATMLSVAGLAGLAPAVRATRIDPIRSLRVE
jgi:predicted permease